jgi:hypothetical protein
VVGREVEESTYQVTAARFGFDSQRRDSCGGEPYPLQLDLTWGGDTSAGRSRRGEDLSAVGWISVSAVGWSSSPACASASASSPGRGGEMLRPCSSAALLLLTREATNAREHGNRSRGGSRPWKSEQGWVATMGVVEVREASGPSRNQGSMGGRAQERGKWVGSSRSVGVGNGGLVPAGGCGSHMARWFGLGRSANAPGWPGCISYIGTHV